MRNPFDILTSTFIDRPKVCLSIGLIGILTISSMAMFIEFDNSEDAFFPDNETVRLLDEVEGEYQASLDFVRIIARMPDGGLDSSDNWVHLADWNQYYLRIRILVSMHILCLAQHPTMVRLASHCHGKDTVTRL